jgi:hypothetical protein
LFGNFCYAGNEEEFAMWIKLWTYLVSTLMFFQLLGATPAVIEATAEYAERICSNYLDPEFVLSGIFLNKSIENVPGYDKMHASSVTGGTEYSRDTEFLFRKAKLYFTTSSYILPGDGQNIDQIYYLPNIDGMSEEEVFQYFCEICSIASSIYGDPILIDAHVRNPANSSSTYESFKNPSKEQLKEILFSKEYPSANCNIIWEVPYGEFFRPALFISTYSGQPLLIHYGIDHLQYRWRSLGD